MHGVSLCVSSGTARRYGKTATGAMTSFQYDAVWDSAMVTGCQCEFVRASGWETFAHNRIIGVNVFDVTKSGYE